MKRGAPLKRDKPLRPASFASLRTLQIRCCGKKRFATQEAAEAALLRISRTTSREKYPRYAYQGDCGWWHLTKLAPARDTRTGRPRDTGPSLHVKAIVDERDDWHCAACGNSVWGRPYSRQHRVARGMGGTSDPRLNAPSNLVLLCGSATSPGGCHLLCEQRDERMNELGFWLKNSQRPWLEPVAHARYGWVYLLDEQRPDGSWVMPAETGGAA
jgi:hypothetical protein